MKEKNRIQLVMRNCSENEGLARTVAAAFAAQADPTMAALTEIKTAVSEAVSNAVIHAYGPEEDGEIILRAQWAKDGRLLFEVEDFGKGIADVKQAMEPLFTTGGEERSGMGFTVMESFMDKVTVESKPGKGTRVTLVKIPDGV
ncbi:MAG: anti-sigma F factor [Clostridiales bacterium]|nr:anti-sigma F factor [Clostridiales bacterium]